MIFIKKLVISLSAFVLLLGACGTTSQGETVKGELNPLNDSFIVDKHEEFANKLKEDGYAKEEANEEAFKVQLREVALLNRATEVGIEVSDKEAGKRAEEMREQLEIGKGQNTEFVLEKIDELIAELNITEDEYWSEYVINSYKSQIMQEKLREYELKENAQTNWNERSQEIIEEFMENEAEQIKKFKSEVGMS
ncbi:hypothetical protein LGQ02_05955 [Bacillus shivajii]|uniref:hypothetical protein n=1 Tax=Bacillus shivajii TaxID=1983719 RepID=UPI001CF96254|nr:hypothetical protein [Bacillus shivajii]UCZ54305.1 hypothetical protein LGQ02_05955 [Bacillus shivajii]